MASELSEEELPPSQGTQKMFFPTTQLIAFVKRNEYLWNQRKSLDFKNLRIKKLAWREIAVKLHSTGKRCKQRWKGIKDNYRKHVSSALLPVSEWKPFRWLPLVSFLQDNLEDSVLNKYLLIAAQHPETFTINHHLVETRRLEMAAAEQLLCEPSACPDTLEYVEEVEFSSAPVFEDSHDVVSESMENAGVPLVEPSTERSFDEPTEMRDERSDHTQADETQLHLLESDTSDSNRVARSASHDHTEAQWSQPSSKRVATQSATSSQVVMHAPLSHIYSSGCTAPASLRHVSRFRPSGVNRSGAGDVSHFRPSGVNRSGGGARPRENDQSKERSPPQCDLSRRRLEPADDLEYFLFSLAPAMRRLSPRYRALARLRLLETVTHFELDEMAEQLESEESGSFGCGEPRASRVCVSQTNSGETLRPNQHAAVTTCTNISRSNPVLLTNTATGSSTVLPTEISCSSPGRETSTSTRVSLVDSVSEPAAHVSPPNIPVSVQITAEKLDSPSKRSINPNIWRDHPLEVGTSRPMLKRPHGLGTGRPMCKRPRADQSSRLLGNTRKVTSTKSASDAKQPLVTRPTDQEAVSMDMVSDIADEPVGKAPKTNIPKKTVIIEPVEGGNGRYTVTVHSEGSPASRPTVHISASPPGSKAASTPSETAGRATPNTINDRNQESTPGHNEKTASKCEEEDKKKTTTDNEKDGE